MLLTVSMLYGPVHESCRLHTFSACTSTCIEVQVRTMPGSRRGARANRHWRVILTINVLRAETWMHYKTLSQVLIARMCMGTQFHSFTRARTHTRTDTHTHAHTHTHTHTHTRAHTHTHTRTHTRTESRSESFGQVPRGKRNVRF